MYTRNFGLMPRTVNGLFEDFLHHGLNRFNDDAGFGNVPVNIKETDAAYEMHVVAPGLNKDDFRINVEKNSLTISFDHKEESKESGEGGKWIRNEYKTRSFKRVFTMNEKIDSGNISARYADGMLVLTLPKKEQAVPAAREIAVN